MNNLILQLLNNIMSSKTINDLVSNLKFGLNSIELSQEERELCELVLSKLAIINVDNLDEILYEIDNTINSTMNFSIGIFIPQIKELLTKLIIGGSNNNSLLLGEPKASEDLEGSEIESVDEIELGHNQVIEFL